MFKNTLNEIIFIITHIRQMIFSYQIAVQLL